MLNSWTLSRHGLKRRDGWRLTISVAARQRVRFTGGATSPFAWKDEEAIWCSEEGWWNEDGAYQGHQEDEWETLGGASGASKGKKGRGAGPGKKGANAYAAGAVEEAPVVDAAGGG